MSEPRTERINLPVRPSEKERYEEAARIMGMSTSAFMRHAADGMADVVIERAKTAQDLARQAAREQLEQAHAGAD